jgi:spore germination protein
VYRIVAAVLFPITLVALVGTAAWGYKENQDKNSILIKAENQYQRAFHELNNHMDKLQDEIGKSLALHTRRQLSTCMANIWRLAYSAQGNIGQLPLSLMPFDKVEQFLGRIGSFAYQVAVRDLNKNPLSQKEWETLNTLYARAKEINGDLKDVQAKVLSENLRWMDVELALATEDKKMDNTIIDGFRTVNHMIEQYPEIDWGPTVNNMEVHRREKYSSLKGKRISTEEAKWSVARLLGRKSTNVMVATLNQKGDYQTYSVRVPQGNGEIYADVTAIGGYPVWMIHDRPVNKSNLTLDQAIGKAEQFLKSRGYPDMAVISYDDEDHSMTFNFCSFRNNVYIYPESVTVKVAMDNGEIIGLQADEYVFNRVGKVNLTPKLSEAEARKRVSPRLQVQKSNLAYIYGDTGKGVLCYEFLGLLKGEQYRVLINAITGDEEWVEKIKKDDQNKRL